MFCQSAIAGYAASLIPEIIDSFRTKSKGYHKIEKQRAWFSGVVGGVAAIVTADPLGGLLVAVETMGHLDASKNNTRFETKYKAIFGHPSGNPSTQVSNPFAHLKGFDSPGGNFPGLPDWIPGF